MRIICNGNTTEIDAASMRQDGHDFIALNQAGEIVFSASYPEQPTIEEGELTVIRPIPMDYDVRIAALEEIIDAQAAALAELGVTV